MFFAVLVFPPDGHKCSSNGPKVPNGEEKLLTTEFQVDGTGRIRGQLILWHVACDNGLNFENGKLESEREDEYACSWYPSDPLLLCPSHGYSFRAHPASICDGANALCTRRLR